jgi:hypothetical protein
VQPYECNAVWQRGIREGFIGLGHRMLHFCKYDIRSAHVFHCLNRDDPENVYDQFV